MSNFISNTIGAAHNLCAGAWNKGCEYGKSLGGKASNYLESQVNEFNKINEPAKQIEFIKDKAHTLNIVVTVMLIASAVFALFGAVRVVGSRWGGIPILLPCAYGVFLGFNLIKILENIPKITDNYSEYVSDGKAKKDKLLKDLAQGTLLFTGYIGKVTQKLN